VIVIFPFEEKIYREAGVPVIFVGHPLIDLVGRSDKPSFLRRHGMSADAPTVAILPGSRANELRRILPDLVGAAERIRSRLPAAQFIVARADLDDELFNPLRHRRSVRSQSSKEKPTVLSAADVVLTASGTATVQPRSTTSR
jgi:lipid-A-disaccharide synthase